MKDLGVATRILGINIRSDRKQSNLCISQETHLKNILDKFGMSNSKHVVTPINPQFKLCTTQSPSNEVERSYMNNILYTSIICTLMYYMICTRSNITYEVNLVNRYITNPRKTHCKL